jgi:hypothetical protein
MKIKSFLLGLFVFINCVSFTTICPFYIDDETIATLQKELYPVNPTELSNLSFLINHIKNQDLTKNSALLKTIESASFSDWESFFKQHWKTIKTSSAEYEFFVLSHYHLYSFEGFRTYAKNLELYDAFTKVINEIFEEEPKLKSIFSQNTNTAIISQFNEAIKMKLFNLIDKPTTPVAISASTSLDNDEEKWNYIGLHFYDNLMVVIEALNNSYIKQSQKLKSFGLWTGLTSGIICGNFISKPINNIITANILLITITVAAIKIGRLLGEKIPNFFLLKRKTHILMNANAAILKNFIIHWQENKPLTPEILHAPFDELCYEYINNPQLFEEVNTSIITEAILSFLYQYNPTYSNIMDRDGIRFIKY